MGKYTIAVDFDGVIHSYTTPWQAPHIIPDPPVKGALQWLHETLQHFDVAIFSTRCKTWRGRRAMRRWLRLWAPTRWASEYTASHPDGPMLLVSAGLKAIKLSKKKPPALIYLDDRAWRFEGPGTFPTKEQIHQARPWNKPTQ